MACRSRSVVGLGRVELPTSRLSGVRSNQLSYRPANQKEETALTAAFPDPAGPGCQGVREKSFEGSASRATHPAVMKEELMVCVQGARRVDLGDWSSSSAEAASEPLLH